MLTRFGRRNLNRLIGHAESFSDNLQGFHREGIEIGPVVRPTEGLVFYVRIRENPKCLLRATAIFSEILPNHVIRFAGCPEELPLDTRVVASYNDFRLV